MKRTTARRLARLALGLLVPATVSALAAEAGPSATDILARIGATPIDCPEEVTRLFRQSVRIECATVEDDFKRFRQKWEEASQSHLEEATRWFRQGKLWRARYYWEDQTPLLALFGVDDGRVALARYDVHEICRERARQLGVDFRTTEQLRPGRSSLRRTAHVYPEFPRNARLAGKSGVILLWSVLDQSGRVTQPCVAHAMPRGYGFELAAMEAVEQWRYEPVTQDGLPVAIELPTRIVFEAATEELPYRALLDQLFAPP